MQSQIDGRKSRREESRREHREKRRAEAERRRLEEAAADPESWGLCAERCAKYVAGFGCRCRVRIPPSMQPRQIPPEECALFTAKGSEA